MKTLIVPKLYNEKKLISYLQYAFPALRQSVIFKALRNKDIRVNKVKVRDNVVVYEGDEIALYINDCFLMPSFTPIVVYEDDAILVVHKPANMEVVGGASSLTALLQEYYHTSSIFPCHRLDCNTLGLVLFAKKEQALSILLEKFKNHEIEKRYVARVYGIPKASQTTLEAYLFKDRKQSKVYISDTFKKGYVKIKTSYRTLHTDTKTHTSILDITLHTGKTHQIRAHLAHIGLPIIGDEKYGNFEVNRRMHCRTQQLQSYCIGFHFVTDSGILAYLNGKEFCVEKNFS